MNLRYFVQYEKFSHTKVLFNASRSMLIVSSLHNSIFKWIFFTFEQVSVERRKRIFLSWMKTHVDYVSLEMWADWNYCKFNFSLFVLHNARQRLKIYKYPKTTQSAIFSIKLWKFILFRFTSVHMRILKGRKFHKVANTAVQWPRSF